MATRADLDGWGQVAERHWLNHRPRAVAALKAKGQLYDYLVEAQTNAAEMYEQLVGQGTPWQVADQMVMAEYILLPDWGEPGGESSPGDDDT